MQTIRHGRPGDIRLMQGNEALARGALEAGIAVAAGYPGTPSSEIIENLAAVAGEGHLYVEFSANEKVALEVAAAASFAELRSLCVMKQVGVNVASDFLLHLAQYGTRGGMVLASCEDPGGLSSTNEGDSRHYAKMMEFPLLEPSDFQEAKDMMRWAFSFSEEIRNVVMVRSVTRLSHASGCVVLGDLPETKAAPRLCLQGSPVGQMEGPIATMPMTLGHIHKRQQEKLKKASEVFEDSPFNTYSGPDHPEILMITSSAAYLYCMEAVELLSACDRVGILRLGTTWPLPRRLLSRYLSRTDKVFIVEELLPFLEDNVKVLTAELNPDVSMKTFHGKKDGTLPSFGELNPDLVMTGLSRILGTEMGTPPGNYETELTRAVKENVVDRSITFCAGCPHRASFWTIHNALEMDGRKGFVCGDIGCYSMGISPAGYATLKTVHAMGSGIGLANGFGQLKNFGLDLPVLAACGDSTFFHAAMPALVNAVHHGATMVLVVLDNSGTGMTGFQAHPGLAINAMGKKATAIDIAEVCKAMGAKVTVSDPFDVQATQSVLLDLLQENSGVRVLILRQICALSPEKKSKKMFDVSVDQTLCLGELCGCNRLCTRIFRCPALVWDALKSKAHVDEILCAGCGVCASICPKGAIMRREVA
jgi:indolepyruvate ferredoxin oxidoreductase alpha subunit